MAMFNSDVSLPEMAVNYGEFIGDSVVWYYFGGYLVQVDWRMGSVEVVWK